MNEKLDQLQVKFFDGIVTLSDHLNQFLIGLMSDILHLFPKFFMACGQVSHCQGMRVVLCPLHKHSGKFKIYVYLEIKTV